MTISCRGLTKYYGSKCAVNGVDLEITSGDIFGLLGPNGAGKSTLIKMITGLIWPSNGTVSVNGFDVHDNHLKAMANVGAIIEWPAFIPYLTARQNLDILSGGEGKDYEKRRAEVVDFVNMTPNLDHRVETFSTGMRQRLGIALALLPESRLVILDEPTNGLDPNGIQEVRQILREGNKTFGTTILLSSHLLVEVEQVCDRIAIIHNGKLAVTGPIKELLKGSGKLCIRAEDPAGAREVISAAMAAGNLPVTAVNINEAEGILEVEVSDDECAAGVNALLVGRGCRISHISAGRLTLEEYFARITGGETDVA